MSGQTPEGRAQTLAALELAQQARRLRAELRRALKDRTVDPLELLRGNEPRWEPAVKGMTVERALTAIPRIGPSLLDEIVAVTGISRHAKLNEIGFAGREELAVQVDLLFSRIGPALP